MIHTRPTSLIPFTSKFRILAYFSSMQIKYTDACGLFTLIRLDMTLGFRK